MKLLGAFEALLAGGLVVASFKTDDNVAKGTLYVGTAYLLLGAYYNFQGRVKLLPAD